MPLEKTDQAVSESIQLFNDFAQKGIDFIQQQSPELCEQIVLKAEIQYLTTFCVFLIISIFLFFLSLKWKSYEKKIAKETVEKYIEYYGAKNGDPSTYSLTNIVQIVSLLPLFIGGACNLYNFMTVFVAPKVYLVEYFTQLIK